MHSTLEDNYWLYLRIDRLIDADRFVVQNFTLICFAIQYIYFIVIFLFYLFSEIPLVVSKVIKLTK